MKSLPTRLPTRLIASMLLFYGSKEKRTSCPSHTHKTSGSNPSKSKFSKK